MKLKTVRYLGCFYEHEGHLGWMPLHRALIVKIFAKDAVKWIPQSNVRFG